MVVLLFACGLLAFAMAVSAILLQPGEDESILLQLLTSLIGYVIYSSVCISTGQSSRIVPAIAAIMACGSILTILSVFAFVMLSPFLGAWLAALVSVLIHFWSVPVKGHIIAHTIEQHWYVGIVIAMFVFIVQFAIYSAMIANF